MRRIVSAAFLAALLSTSAGAQPVPGPPPATGGGASLSASQTFTGEQRNAITPLVISTATFTPDNSNNNYKIGLTSACPCTLANPTTVTPGAAGVLEVDQDGTGSRTIGTWGSDYIAPGGTSTLALSTAASAKDFFSYLVLDSTHILIVAGGLNASH